MEQFILGAIQGIAEWLPVSSEGMIVLAKINLFASGQTVSQTVKEALFLHLGTFLAALVYFRKDVWQITKSTLSFKKSATETKNLITFLFLSTLISGIIGFMALAFLEKTAIDLESAGKIITFLIGLLLVVTGSLQIKAKSLGLRKTRDLKICDGIILGLAQGLASFPGLSRSGTTVSALLFRKFDKKTALKLSFLMSLPIVFIGNVLLNLDQITNLDRNSLLGLVSSFIFGITTIHVLLKTAQKINFGLFVAGFGLLTIILTLAVY